MLTRAVRKLTTDVQRIQFRTPLQRLHAMRLSALLALMLGVCLVVAPLLHGRVARAAEADEAEVAEAGEDDEAEDGADEYGDEEDFSEEDVLVMTKENFDSTISSKEFVLVRRAGCCSAPDRTAFLTLLAVTLREYCALEHGGSTLYCDGPCGRKRRTCWLASTQRRAGQARKLAPRQFELGPGAALS